jgi:P-type Mg2+ transporter
MPLGRLSFHASETQFHTGRFVESLMTQTLVLFVIRTAKNPLQSRPSGLLIATCLAAVNVGIYLPFSSFACALGFTPMPASHFGYLSAATLVYLLIVQAAKGLLFRQAGAATSTKVRQKLAVATQ